MYVEKIIFDNYMTRMCRKKEVLAHKYGIALKYIEMTKQEKKHKLIEKSCYLRKK